MFTMEIFFILTDSPTRDLRTFILGRGLLGKAGVWDSPGWEAQGMAPNSPVERCLLSVNVLPALAAAESEKAQIFQFSSSVLSRPHRLATCA